MVQCMAVLGSPPREGCRIIETFEYLNRKCPTRFFLCFIALSDVCLINLPACNIFSTALAVVTGTTVVPSTDKDEIFLSRIVRFMSLDGQTKSLNLSLYVSIYETYVTGTTLLRSLKVLKESLRNMSRISSGVNTSSKVGW